MWAWLKLYLFFWNQELNYWLTDRHGDNFFILSIEINKLLIE